MKGYDSGDDTMPSSPSQMLPELRYTIAILSEPGSVTEMTVVFEDQWRRQSNGFFDDQEALIQEAGEFDLEECEFYVTLNPVKAALLERSPNSVSDEYTSPALDTDIVRRRWLLIDFDPVRPTGVPATCEEMEACFKQANNVLWHLQDEGQPDPVIADSGNGFNFLYRADLPNDWESQQLVKDVLQSLAAKFDNERAKINISVYKADQRVRLYGTMNRKDEATIIIYCNVAPGTGPM